MSSKLRFLVFLAFFSVLSMCFFVNGEILAAPSKMVSQVRLTPDDHIYDLSAHIAVVEDERGQDNLYKALGKFANGSFLPLNEYQFDENKDSAYWFIFRIRNSDPDRENWILDLGRSVSNTIGVSNLLYYYNSEDFSEKQVIDGRYIKAKKQLPGQNHNALPMIVESHSIQTVAIYIEPVRGLNFKVLPRLMDARLYPSLEHSYTNSGAFLTLLWIAFIVLAGFFYFKWQNIGFIVLGFYVIVSAAAYMVSDEIIPYGNNTGAVIIDILFATKIIASIIFSYLLLAPIKSDTSRISGPIWVACFFTMVGLIIGSFNYDLNQYSSLIIFGYLSLVVPLFLVLKSLHAFIKTIKIPSALLFGVAWLVLVVEFVVDNYRDHTMVADDFNLYTISIITHLIILFISSVLIIEYRNKQAMSHVKQEKLRLQAEDEIKKTYEIVSRNQLIEVVQRERDLLLDLKRHDSEIMQEEREEKDAKIKFLAMISHEIRTPMTGIMGLVNLLNGTTLNEKQKEYVDTLHQTGNALLLMLNDILDLSKAESGKMQIEYIDFDIRDTVKHVANIMIPFAHERNIQLNVGIAENVPKILVGDPSRLRQILTNLLSNAIKFTDEGYVNMIVKYDRQMADESHNILFVVEDTGIGIADEHQEHLFEPYIQAGSSVSRKFGGTGLGLAICFQLVNSMNGEISLKSVEGKGSTFYFNLPMQEGEDPDAIEEEVEETEEEVDDDKVNILLVDDHDSNRKIMAMQMKQKLGKKMGELMTAGGGMETMNLMEKHRFDVVFMDLEMPDFSGIAVTDMIRKMSDREKARTPIIAMTAHKDEEVIASCIQSGMNDFIEKPLDLDKLGTIISNVANKADLDAAQLGAGLGGELRNEKVPQMTDEDIEKQNIKVGDPNKLEVEIPADTIDEALLNSIKKSMPAEDYNKMIDELFISIEKEIEKLDKAVAKRNLEQVKFHTHTIYGAAENFGFNAIGYIARKVYRHANNNDEIEIISKYASKIEGIYKETIDDLNAFNDGE